MSQKFISHEYYARENKYEKTKEIYFNEEFEDVVKCARYFKIERRTLVRRIHDSVFKSTRRVANQRLNEIQKNVILDYIRRLNDQCMSSSFELIVKVVNFIIQKTDDFAFFVDRN